MKATKRKLSRAEKIRRFIRSNPNAPISYIASQFDTTYGVVYMVKRNMEGKALKKPKMVKVLGVTMAKDDVTKLTDEQVSRLAYNATKPKARMKSSDSLNAMIKEAEDARKEMAITMIEPPADPVNHPAHYKVGGIETIDYIKAKLTPEEYRGYLKGNLLKYSSRIGHKGAAQIDAGKAGWYANALVQTIEENSKPT